MLHNVTLRCKYCKTEKHQFEVTFKLSWLRCLLFSCQVVNVRVCIYWVSVKAVLPVCSCTYQGFFSVTVSWLYPAAQWMKLWSLNSRLMGAPVFNLAGPCCYTTIHSQLEERCRRICRVNSFLCSVTHSWQRLWLLFPLLICNRHLWLISKIQLRQSTLFMHGFYFCVASVHVIVFNHVSF